MQLLNSFFKQRETLLGIAAAVAFQLIFVIVWLTGYDGVYERTDQFTVGLINEDPIIGAEITGKLKDNYLFQIKEFEDLSSAKQELDERNISIVIQDRKSTRLNSSHVAISYAVFYWKK